MQSFYMNGYIWHVQIVDRNSPQLVDGAGEHRLGTTDVETRHLYLSDELRGDLLTRVLVHELSHCAIFSYGLLYDVHKMVKPEYWLDMEEFLCNFMADRSAEIFGIARSLLGGTNK